ncbi:MAG: hypothetical protein NTZ25_03405 [Candidatus Peregrinibacteria bacterium]|nr:hypothetical protein [Candidatus Peregrinibacteria bacterium]
MDFSASKNSSPENLSSSPETKVDLKKKEELKPSKEVREASDVGKAAYAEAVGLDESLETTGKVSEVLGDSTEGDNTSLGGAKPVSPKVDPAVIKANLLKNLPSEAVMKKQIEVEIKKEIEYLHKKAMKMFRTPGQVSYFEMNNVLKKIRELKGLLLALVKASFDGLKTLWLRFVHGIM